MNYESNKLVAGGQVASETGWTKFRWYFRSGWLERFLYHVASQQWCGSDHEPLDHRHLQFESDGVKRVFSFFDGVHEVGIGYPTEWQVIMRSRDFNRMVRWYLWHRVVTDWLGFRTRLWYWLLHRRIQNNQREALHLTDAPKSDTDPN